MPAAGSEAMMVQHGRQVVNRVLLSAILRVVLMDLVEDGLLLGRTSTGLGSGFLNINRNFLITPGPGALLGLAGNDDEGCLLGARAETAAGSGLLFDLSED